MSSSVRLQKEIMEQCAILHFTRKYYPVLTFLASLPCVTNLAFTKVSTGGKSIQAGRIVKAWATRAWVLRRRNQSNVSILNTTRVQFYRVIETRADVWENEKCCENTSRQASFPQLFRVLPYFHECFYNCP